VSGRRIGVFLDRDGTLNEELNFIRTADELHMIPGAAAAVRMLNQRGVITCVISNQSGVGRGYLKESDLIPIHHRLEEQLRNEGAHVDQIYYCPHHPTEGMPPYNVECDCRKPKPGMLKRGSKEFNLDLSDSFVVGDSVVDIQAGNAVGATTVLVLTGYGADALDQCRRNGIAPDYVAPTIVQAIDFITHTLDGSSRDDDR
jgi:D-glycero-D-manno-heptose 1,7-bisphosphate phosphatase